MCYSRCMYKRNLFRENRSYISKANDLFLKYAEISIIFGLALVVLSSPDVTNLIKQIGVIIISIISTSFIAVDIDKLIEKIKISNFIIQISITLLSFYLLHSFILIFSSLVSNFYLS